MSNFYNQCQLAACNRTHSSGSKNAETECRNSLGVSADFANGRESADFSNLLKTEATNQKLYTSYRFCRLLSSLFSSGSSNGLFASAADARANRLIGEHQRPFRWKLFESERESRCTCSSNDARLLARRLAAQVQFQNCSLCLSPYQQVVILLIIIV